MEGHLKKWVNMIQRWQDRYFILNDDILVYCDSKGGPTKGQVHLKVSAIIMVLEDPLRFIINTGTSELNVRATTVADKIKWINALKKAQEQCLQEDELYVHESNNLKQQSQGQRINDCLADIWVTQAQFDETMSLLKPLLEKNSKVRELAQRVEVLGKNLKNKITLCTKMLEDQQRMVDTQRQQQGSIHVSSPPVLYFNEHNLDMLRNDSFQNKEHDNQTIFQSFRDNHSEGSVSSHVNQEPNKQVSLTLSMSSLVEDLKSTQPIKYKNLVNNLVFKNLRISPSKTRLNLPRTQDPKEKIDIWGILKNMIGKDLTRVAVPVQLNEPLSMLQRFCELVEYYELMTVANKETDSCLQMCYIMAYGVSAYSSTIDRLKKPFNPILGETFELIHKDFNFVSEQVSHHPPITAGYVENADYESWGNTDIKSKFYGKSMEFRPVGSTHIVLKRSKDHYTFTKCLTLVKNILFGELYIDNAGEMNFTNHNNRDVGVLILTERGSNKKGAFELHGTVKDAQGVERYTLKGRWDDKIIATNSTTKKETLIWQRHTLPPNHQNYYFFTNFAIQLNHINASMIKSLPCTDCRLRPDQQALEQGFLNLATDEKSRLEDKQRQRRKQMSTSGETHKPQYFNECIDPLTQESGYVFNHTYWGRRSNQEGLDLF